MKTYILAAILAAGTATSGLSPSEQISTCSWRLTEAIAHSSTPLAAKLAASGEYQTLKHRWEKSDAIKVWLENDDTVWIEVHWHGQFLRIYSVGKTGIVFLDPEIERKPKPIAALQVMAVSRSFTRGIKTLPRDRRLIGKIAAQNHCDAAINQNHVIFLPKYFRQSQNKDAFRRAILKTIAFDLGSCDIDSELSEALMRFGECAGDLRNRLNTLPTFSRRQHDSRELPIPIQRKIAHAVELYWQASEWRLVQSAYLASMQGEH